MTIKVFPYFHPSHVPLAVRIRRVLSANQGPSTNISSSRPGTTLIPSTILHTEQDRNKIYAIVVRPHCRCATDGTGAVGSFSWC
ncbi:hypothetical protein BGZ61DRAFT_440857, partial [Ilyonectria robusta]|uniref:uncharacterized protein n=1 Tax=Ilyonectria robusta TaxID=1079257 RepID=UPI001E8CF05D